MLVCSAFPGGDGCEEPLCDTLSVSVSGHVYFTQGYIQISAGTPLGIYEDMPPCLAWTSYGSCRGVLPRCATDDDREPVANDTAPPTQARLASASAPASASYAHSPSTWYQGTDEDGDRMCARACILNNEALAQDAPVRVAEFATLPASALMISM